ncbi:hypothetical protein CP532_3924 [Ophiocordyceps camponoti-leonardi (nom. inval.)]|nr:hypothetical protein CP532_3924 [Ophiocordyceps camponoti-leonardi (nom. inval.)]
MAVTKQRQQLRCTSREFRKRRQFLMRRRGKTALEKSRKSFPHFQDGRVRRRWARDSRNGSHSSAGHARLVRGASPLLAMAATAVATEELDRLSLMARRADAGPTGVIDLTLEPPPRRVSKGEEGVDETGSKPHSSLSLSHFLTSYSTVSLPVFQTLGLKSR